jgi:hypothetical protein
MRAAALPNRSRVVPVGRVYDFSAPSGRCHVRHPSCRLSPCYGLSGARVRALRMGRAMAARPLHRVKGPVRSRIGGSGRVFSDYIGRTPTMGSGVPGSLVGVVTSIPRRLRVVR